MSNTNNRELLRHYYEQGLAMGLTEDEAEEFRKEKKRTKNRASKKRKAEVRKQTDTDAKRKEPEDSQILRRQRRQLGDGRQSLTPLTAQKQQRRK